MTANPTDAGAGMPSEEAIARLIALAMDADPDVLIGMNGKLPDYMTEAAASILALIRPAFEAVRDYPETAFAIELGARLAAAHDARLSAEAKLAQAVEALRPFAWPPLYVFDKDQAFVPTTMPEDWEGGGYFTTEDFSRARSAAALASGKERP